MTRQILCIACLSLLAVAVAAQPPVPSRSELPPPLRLDSPLPPSSLALREAIERLKNERDALERARRQAANEMERLGGPDETMRLKLRLQIADLLRRLNEKYKPPTPPEPPPRTPVRPPEPAPLPPPTPGNPLALAQVQFRGKQYDAALKTLRTIDLTTLSPRDQAWVRYLMAGCLRHLGNLAEAATLYREVAAAREDEFLTESAVWQLSFIRWRQETQTQLEELRRRTP